MKERYRGLRGVLIALVALAFSASLVYGAAPQAASGLVNAAAHAGKTVPVAGGAEDPLAGDDEAGEEDELEDAEGDEEDVEGDVEGEEDGANCTDDPTLLTPEQLDAAHHGSLVCWAAHQTEWPAWFANHGAWVRCWAHQGKADATSCTEDPNAVEPTTEEPTDESTADAPTTELSGKGHGKAKGKNKQKPNRD